MDLLLTACLALPLATAFAPQGSEPGDEAEDPTPILVQVLRPPVAPGAEGLPEIAFEELEVRAVFSRSVRVVPGEEPLPSRFEPEGLAVGADGRLAIPRPEGSWGFQLTLESDHAYGQLGSEAQRQGDEPIELVLRVGRPVTLRLVPPVGSVHDAGELVGRKVWLRGFQQSRLRAEEIDQRSATIDDRLEVRARAFDFGSRHEGVDFRHHPLAMQLLPFRIDPSWAPPSPDDGTVVEVPLVDTCTALVRPVGADGESAEQAKASARTSFGTTLSGRETEPGLIVVRGLPTGEFLLEVAAEGYAPSYSVHVARVGEFSIEIPLAELPDDGIAVPSEEVRSFPYSRGTYPNVGRWSLADPNARAEAPETGSVRFAAIRASTGEPEAAGVVLRGLLREGRDGGRPAHAFPLEFGPDGMVWALAVEPGRYLAHFTSKDRWRSALAHLHAKAGEELDLGILEFGRLRLVILDGLESWPDRQVDYGVGEPGPGAAFFPWTGPRRSSQVSVPRNTEWIRLHWSNPVTGRTEAEVVTLEQRAGDPLMDVVEARAPSGFLEVRVTDRGGRSAALYTCELRWQDGSRRSVLLDRDGAGVIPFRRDGSAPPSELWILPPDEPGARVALDRGPVLRRRLGEDELRVPLQIVLPAAEIVGRVLGHDPRARAPHVRLLPYPVPDDLELAVAPSGALRPDGSFVVRHAPEDGRFVVAVVEGAEPVGASGFHPRGKLWVTSTSAPIEVRGGTSIDRLVVHSGLGVRLPDRLVLGR